MARTFPSLSSCAQPVRSIVTVLGVSILAGCGGDDRTDTAGEPGGTAGTAVPSATQPAGGTMTATAEQTFTIRVTDQGVEVSPASARPGPATFQVTNNATHPQEIEIDGPGEDGEIDNLAPNQTRSVNMTLQAGDYEIKSEHEGRPDQSRRARLVVQN